MNLTYRVATLDDSKLIFNWRNDPEACRQSFNTNPIKWENHIKWFEKRYNESLILIFFKEIPVGQIRVDFNEEIELSLSVDEIHRVKGIATKMIVEAVRICKITNRLPVIAKIKNSNIASIKAFEKAAEMLTRFSMYHQVYNEKEFITFKFDK